MDKLSQFYMDLATDSNKMAEFNTGNNEQEIADSRRRMLQAAGCASSDEIISLSQAQLRDLMAENLAKQSADWQNLSTSSPNTNNTNNNIGLLGRRRGN